MNRGFDILASLSALVLSVMLFVSCGREDAPVSVVIRNSSAAASGGTQFVSVEASGDWTLTIVVEGAQESVDWAWLGTFDGDEQTAVLSGSGNLNTVVFNWAVNLSEDERSCTLLLECGESRASCLFTQKGAEAAQQTVTQIKSDSYQRWMELPAFTVSDNLYLITHTLSNSTGRNWSCCWDTDALVARWVAYPLNKGTIGNGSRTNQWGLDPKVPRDCQPVLFFGYRGGYQRGHQLPSADRLEYNANISTFYGTNMTPQLGALNEQAWAGLEGMVRNWSYSVDTLYVVTGCTVDGSTAYAYDNDGKRVTVPTGYFKALLGYKRGGSAGSSTGGYFGIGFYFEHKGYSNDRSVIMGQSMTIDALEEKTGLDFFANLPYSIGLDKAGKVESTVESFWGK